MSIAERPDDSRRTDSPLYGRRAGFKMPEDDGEVWIISYEDADCPQELFSGTGATDAARCRFEQLSTMWSCHLFRRVSPPIDIAPDPRDAEIARLSAARRPFSDALAERTIDSQAKEIGRLSSLAQTERATIARLSAEIATRDAALMRAVGEEWAAKMLSGPVRCPVGLEANHWVCSAGYCDICQADLRRQIGMRNASLAIARDALEHVSNLIAWSKSTADATKIARAALAKLSAPQNRPAGPPTPPDGEEDFHIAARADVAAKGE